jgi:hypothetical protein
MEYYDRLTNSQGSIDLIPQGQLRSPRKGHVGLDPEAYFPSTGPVNQSNDQLGVWRSMPGDDS